MALSLFQYGAFWLHSGGMSSFKVECDAITAGDWHALAALVSQHTSFSTVEGVPRGGLPFSAVLLRYASGNKTDGLLIVDDVLTTGASMERHRDGRQAKGIVVFARGTCPAWVIPIWQLAFPPT